MAIFTISDLHLSFGVDKPMDIFGGAWEGHAEKIAENWKQAVRPEDFVVLPGDHSWALQIQEVILYLQFIHRLPGTKILLKGNHDLWWGTSRKMEEFKNAQGLTSLIFLYNDSILVRSSGKMYAIAGTRGWLCPGDAAYKQPDEKIYLREAARLRASIEKAKQQFSQIAAEERGEILVFLHYPPFHADQGTLFTECIESSGVRNCYYGHLHGFSKQDREEALRSNYRLHENGTAYSLVSCDYTGNRLIQIV